MNKKTIERISWQKLRDTGLLVFVNSFLHIFGMAICVEVGDDGKISDAYPARCRFRGFDEDTNTKAYEKLTRHIVVNHRDLLEDMEEE